MVLSGPPPAPVTTRVCRTTGDCLGVAMAHLRECLILAGGSKGSLPGENAVFEYARFRGPGFVAQLNTRLPLSVRQARLQTVQDGAGKRFRRVGQVRGFGPVT